MAVGIALDTLYSHHRGMLGESEARVIVDTLRNLGFELRTPLLRELPVERALEDFREHLGSRLCITLLEGIGRGVDVHEVDTDVMRKCVYLLLGWGGGKVQPGGGETR